MSLKRYPVLCGPDPFILDAVYITLQSTPSTVEELTNHFMTIGVDICSKDIMQAINHLRRKNKIRKDDQLLGGGKWEVTAPNANPKQEARRYESVAGVRRLEVGNKIVVRDECYGLGSTLSTNS